MFYQFCFGFDTALSLMLRPLDSHILKLWLKFNKGMFSIKTYVQIFFAFVGVKCYGVNGMLRLIRPPSAIAD